jgi:hypothetical protein
MVHVTVLSVTLNDKMVSELRGTRKAAKVAQFSVLSRQFHKTEENNEQTESRWVVPVLSNLAKT